MQPAKETKGSQTIFHKYIRNKTKENVDPLIRREGKTNSRCIRRLELLIPLML